MTTLITGAAGFIGSAVARALLARGDAVVGIDNFEPYYDVALKHARVRDIEVSARQGTFQLVQCDFADPEALAQTISGHKIARIVHLGAQPGVRYSIENPHAYARANLLGHLNILELARQLEIEHLVYASSSSVYGGNEKLPFSVDDRSDHPVSLYAATKRADELMSESYAHLYRIPMTGLRFFTVYGPWGRPDMMPWIFTSKILAGEPIQVFNHGKMRRDFTFIDDIVAGVTACLDSSPQDNGEKKPGGSHAPHALYNIGNNRAEELMKVVGIIEQACGRKAEIELLPMQPGDVTQTYADIDAIRNDLGYEPTTPVEVGFPNFVEWYRAYHDI
ncbi:GDP-mannose 4,6-dehydratase [Altererythrobacter sp. MF3-039]|uniref:GDP-mannose 4,6-dehydratase n=1 Tax=Altererythrobacter sp. MF3-039 TaxID=3252901 RepID=UPI00390C448F